ncbi:VP1/VP3 family protein [Sulfolobus sp. E11-6]
MSYIQNVTTPYYTTVITSGTLTQTSTISNTNYAGSTGSILVSVVPIFYILILIIVPAVIAYKYWREE